MRAMLRSIWRGIKTHHRTLLKTVGWLIIILVVVNAIFYFASSYSPFCVVCHYMKPYYEQWKQSVHSDVSCVKCHPNRRILTAPYLFRYLSGTYNPRPRAEVTSGICLECHPEKSLHGKTAFKMQISFDHGDHLGDLRRGKRLRCTSCHARGMENEHFTVDQNVCFTCHFKGAERGHAITGCQVCHGSPKQVVEHEGFSFNHQMYLKIGVDCAQCHVDVVNGNAEVEPKRCYSCHVERLSEFSNTEKLHNVHITKHGIDCSDCHNQIQHGEIRLISPLEAGCENCHKKEHTAQREMYIGIGGRNVSDTPSRMFAAQVSCEGCHLDLNNDGKSDLREKREACVRCHGAGYDKMLDKWRSKISDAAANLSGNLEYAKQLVRDTKWRLRRQKKNIKAEEAFLDDAVFNFNFVQQGKSAHNVDYAVKLLGNVADNIEGIVRLLSNPNYKLRRNKLLLKESNEFCNLCHFTIPAAQTVEFEGQKFPHQLHTANNPCVTCHSREVHKQLTITRDGCEKCHSSIKEAQKITRFTGMEFPHERHSKELKINCGICHTSGVFKKGSANAIECANCHHQVGAYRDTPLLDCKKCHSLQSEFYTGTFESAQPQPDVMQAASITCADCHVIQLRGRKTVKRPEKEVCSNCHEKSYEDMYIEWQMDVVKTSDEIVQLLGRMMSADLNSQDKKLMKETEDLLGSIKKDGSKGIHNYQLISSLLAAKKKALSQLLGAN